MNYSLWLEFEEYAGQSAGDVSDGYCNALVTFANGREQAYNVWTLECFRDRYQSIIDAVLADGFAMFPDIIVSRLERNQIIKAIEAIIA